MNASQYKIKENNFKIFNLKIGDKIEILEMVHFNSRYVKAEIIDIIKKRGYNLYLCKNIRTGCKITFTDKELNEARMYKIVKL